MQKSSARMVPREPTPREELKAAVAKCKKAIDEHTNAEKALTTAEENLKAARRKLTEAEDAANKGRAAHKERLRAAAKAGTTLLANNTNSYVVQVETCKQNLEDAKEVLQEMQELLGESKSVMEFAVDAVKSKRKRVMADEHFKKSIDNAKAKLEEFLQAPAEPHFLAASMVAVTRLDSPLEFSEYSNLLQVNIRRRLEVMGAPERLVA
jgi:hypothetical protein